MNTSNTILEDPFFYNNPNTLQLPLCKCEPEAEEAEVPNITLIIILLPLLSFCGLICNIISIIIFTKYSKSVSNSNLYLAGLSISDIGVCCSGIFIITADSLRKYFLIVNEIFARLIPFLIPLGFTFQMFSVYITILASVDCYVFVITQKYPNDNNENPKKGIFKIFSSDTLKKYCTDRMYAYKALGGTIIFVIAYNAITFWELQSIHCFDKITQIEKIEVCPTSMRINDNYVKFYKGYSYSFFMAGFPFFLLSLLTVGILKEMKPISKLSTTMTSQLKNSVNIHSQLLLFNRKRSFRNLFSTSNEMDEKSESSPVMLVMVVILFLVCNMVTLIVNYLETTEEVISFALQMVLIDIANFLVVFNATANFFIYISFSRSYRKRLGEICSLKTCTIIKNEENITEISKV
uniref:G_PROTEIN_RECEP_F1_2 domain-containing protein n=1 Tax=Parastrongyloides trichosuri TaxID=131310 RepID=A0A0N4ZE00_PARTI